VSRLILLVDDEPDIREVARLSLETLAGWRVEEAPDGPTALERLGSLRPDLIVLDVMMPGWDGPTTLARIREAGVDVPVVLLTAKAQAADLRGVEALDVAAVLAKPFDPMVLHEQIARAAGW
jgi:CheY-like chemotaxis protein